MSLASKLSIGLLLLTTIVLAGVSPASAASSRYKDVCASGCTYSTVQAAIDSITDSSATNVYTVFIDAGVLPTDASITTNGKSYINFEGRGMGVSVVRGSTTWFNNGAGGSDSTVDLLTLDGSTNITIRGLTLDAKTDAPPGLPIGIGFNGLNIKSGHKVILEGAEVLALIYGIWEETSTAGNLIELFDTKVRSATFGIAVGNTTWHIFASDIRGVRNGENTPQTAAGITKLSGTMNTTVWGSHIHGETSTPGETGIIAGVFFNTGNGLFELIGSTAHVKITTTDIGSATRGMGALYHVVNGVKMNIIGSQVIYETPASISQGRIGGLLFSGGSMGPQINLSGTDIRDAGGSGGTQRADVLPFTTIGTLPVVRATGSRITSILHGGGGGGIPPGTASQPATVNTQRGTVTLSGGQAIVTFPANSITDTGYSVALTGTVNEVFYMINKTAAGFTVKSSNGTSTAVVDWTVTR